jgi:hypothetical protein
MTIQPPYQKSNYIVKEISPEVEGAATISMVLEIIFGLFGVLGIGHVYTGRVALGILLMILWWVYIASATIISVFTLGIAACVFVPLYIAIPIISGIQARTYMLKSRGTGSWLSVIITGGIGCFSIIMLSLIALVGISILSVLTGGY